MAEFPLDILLDGIDIVSELTQGLQGRCLLQQFAGQSNSGDELYGATKSFLAIVDYTSKQIQRNGQFVMTGGTVIALESISPLGVVTDPPRMEPIDTRDKLILPDNSIVPILDTPGSVMNPETNQGLVPTIMIGPRQ